MSLLPPLAPSSLRTPLPPMAPEQSYGPVVPAVQPWCLTEALAPKARVALALRSTMQAPALAEFLEMQSPRAGKSRADASARGRAGMAPLCAGGRLRPASAAVSC